MAHPDLARARPSMTATNQRRPPHRRPASATVAAARAASALLSGVLAACAPNGQHATLQTRPAPPQLAIATYMQTLNRPGTPTTDVAQCLCETRRTQMLQQRQELLDQVTANLRRTYPIVQFTVEETPITQPTGPQTTIDADVWATATGIDQHTRPITFQSPHLPWQFTLTRTADGWTICQSACPPGAATTNNADPGAVT